MPEPTQRPKDRFWPCPYCHGRPIYTDVIIGGEGPIEECPACEGTGDGRVYMAHKRRLEEQPDA